MHVNCLLLALGRFPLHFQQQLFSGRLLLQPILNVASEWHFEVLEVDRPAVEPATLCACFDQLVGAQLRRPDLCRVVENVADVVVVGRHRRATD